MPVTKCFETEPRKTLEWVVTSAWLLSLRSFALIFNSILIFYTSGAVLAAGCAGPSGAVLSSCPAKGTVRRVDGCCWAGTDGAVWEQSQAGPQGLLLIPNSSSASLWQVWASD